MHPDEDAIVKAIQTNPADDLRWLVYADWLAEHDWPEDETGPERS